MADRYISSSERAAALAEGTHLYAIHMNQVPGSIWADGTKERWDEWQNTWGVEMATAAIRLQGEMFDIAQRLS